MQNKKLLIISSVWVEPNSSAAGSRMLQLIVFFQSQAYDVAYASTSVSSDFAVDLSAIGVESRVVMMNNVSFDDFICELQPDVVLFDRFMVEEQFGWRVAKHCPKALRVLDTEDLHCLRDARQSAYKKKLESTTDMLFSDVAKREVASIFRSDLTLMISEYEMELLQSVFKVDKCLLFYLPIVVEASVMNKFENRLPFDERKDFVFIGNFLHEPNWNCVQVLKTEIWPLLSKQLPKANLLIYGAYPSHKVFQLDNPKERFYIKGRAESAQQVIESAKVLLAPIRFGAGIKGKLLEAMLYGTPSVTTSVGAESMHDNLSWNGFIEDDNESFIEKAVALYTDEPLWKLKQYQGFTIIQNRFAATDFFERLHAAIQFLLSDLETHRRHNFIGSMLQHHTLQSTHYMAKWIEEKNKK
ncbi:group 1 glycosyl transferase [Flavobacterium cauense R2A-7]|uniref:Glycosyltransferase involved in cell wall biosynthesis n=1 Tax=Flavobacterium cauense R2A-7 TaxID=1341154 RepID=V6S431_9FLAO|nr:glycosyltransferase [Flavobacterium cauense]ESU21017.1 group 1 glycosyl transferase [Flavobacterium cauense R2A-7]TWI08314.1 glycosyltransferase involved in cell wall biosynthesis [Flavobacterium cauense R2A-7]